MTFVLSSFLLIVLQFGENRKTTLTFPFLPFLVKTVPPPSPKSITRISLCRPSVLLPDLLESSRAGQTLQVTVTQEWGHLDGDRRMRLWRSEYRRDSTGPLEKGRTNIFIEYEG